MRLRSCLGSLLLGLGLVLIGSQGASAICLHGFSHCGSCGTTYGYPVYAAYPAYQPMMLTPVATTGFATVNPGVTSRPPGFIPALPYPGAGAAASQPSSPYAVAAVAPPAYASYSRSMLQGYQPTAPIMQVPAGTTLSDGHLFASHIFNMLQRFGATMTQPQLLDLASKLFTDVAGVLPGSPELTILEQIVQRFIASRAPGGTAPGTTSRPDAGPSGPASTITITITIQAPENVDVRVDRRPPQTTPGQPTPTPTPTPGQTGTSGPPTEAATPTPPVPGSR